MIDNTLLKHIQEYIDSNIEGLEICSLSANKAYIEPICDKCNIEPDFIPEPEASFSETLLKLIDDRKLTDSDVYNKANIDRRLFSKIRCEKDYKPSKQTVLAFCIALQLDIEDTEDLLERAGYALSYSDRADLIVRFFIEEKDNYTIFDVDEALMSFNQKPITKY